MADHQKNSSGDEKPADSDAETVDAAPLANVASYVSRYSTAPSHLMANEAGSNLDDLDGSLDDHWSVPWSDLMMVMFVLFAVLLSAQMSETALVQTVQPQTEPLSPLSSGLEEPVIEEKELEKESEKDHEVLDDIRDSLFDPLSARALFAQSEQFIKESTLENVKVVLLEDDTVKVSVVGPTYFNLGSAGLNNSFKLFLKGLADILQPTNYEVRVIGHTDSYPISTPTYPTNWELSAARAAAVTRYLIKAGNMEPGRFTAIGKSMYQPVSPNTSLANRNKNRRVEILISRNEYIQKEVEEDEYL
ncbi:MAG: flagellar motor protein MotB [Gammaproteobacteria bacterium]|nr:flagellar motor protein MotB [Gammaproteobacteria bacterium]